MKKDSRQISYLESIANELLAKYRRLDSILSHAPSKGTYHEKILRDVIRDYLPNTFSTGEGFIMNKNGDLTSQLDILIVDNLDPRSFGYKDQNFFIAADLAATCIGEVKTYCTKKEFIESFEKLTKASELVSSPKQITSFLFCYDAHATKETFRKWQEEASDLLLKKGDVNPLHFPNHIFCFKKEVLLERHAVPGGIQYMTATSKKESSSVLRQMMVQNLIQCVTDGCVRIRLEQGVNLKKSLD